MTSYRAATGHDVALGSLTVINPQPASQGMEFFDRRPAGNGVIVDHGGFFVWRWSAALETTAKNTLYTLLGFTLTQRYSEATIYTRHEDDTWGRYNVMASLQQGKHRFGAWEDFEIVFATPELLA